MAGGGQGVQPRRSRFELLLLFPVSNSRAPLGYREMLNEDLRYGSACNLMARQKKMRRRKPGMLKGTLDMLILKVISLEARQSDVRGMVVRQGGVLDVIGVAVGVTAAVGLTRLLEC